MLPLTIDRAGEQMWLYPDLEDEFARTARPVDIIIVEERSEKIRGAPRVIDARRDLREGGVAEGHDVHRLPAWWH